MDNIMQNLAKNLINALKYLEKGIKETTSEEREKSMLNILKVLELKMDLSQKIIQGLIYASLNLLGEKGIHETETINLLRICEILLSDYSKKTYFLPVNQENNKIFSFLAKIAIEDIKSEAKEIALKSSNICTLLGKFLPKENLMQIYPAMCSEHFKIILEVSPKTFSKMIHSCLDFFIATMEKLFSDFKPKDALKTLNTSIISMTKKIIQKNEKKEPQTNDFSLEASKKFCEFFIGLRMNLSKYPEKDSITNKFIFFIENIFDKFLPFLFESKLEVINSLIDIYLHFVSIDEKDPRSTKLLQVYPKLRYDLKNKQIKMLKGLQNLQNEVETQIFLSTFRRLRSLYRMSIEAQNIFYSTDEIEDISQSLLRSMKIRFVDKIILTNELYNEFEPSKLIKKKLTTTYITETHFQSHKAWSRFMTAYMPITNFEEKVFEEIIKLFESMDHILLSSLQGSFFQQFLENKFKNTEELITTLFIFYLIMKSLSNTELDQQAFEFFITNPFENVDSRSIIRRQENKLLISVLSILITMEAYKKIKTGSNHPILTGRILVYLFGVFYQENTLQSILVWDNLIGLADSVKTFEEFTQIYSPTLIGNFIDKLKIMHMLQDPELPFRIISSFICFSDPFSVLALSENLILQLNRYFDRFYLKDDMTAIKQVFPIYKIILEAIDNCFLSNLEKSKLILKTSNSLRRVLMRIKPFILSQDRHISFYSLQILNLSCRPLFNLEMETEDSKVNFSPEDPPNVVIPESLGPVAWEFFDPLIFKIKKNESLAMTLECLKFIKVIQEFNERFLINEARFELQVLPHIKKWLDALDKEHLNNLGIKILETTIEILMRFDLENYGLLEGIKTQTLEFAQVLSKILDKNEKTAEISYLISRASSLIQKYTQTQ